MNEIDTRNMYCFLHKILDLTVKTSKASIVVDFNLIISLLKPSKITVQSQFSSRIGTAAFWPGHSYFL